MKIVSTEASKEVHRLAREMTKYWPQMQEEFMSALSDWELDMRKACEEAFSMELNLRERKKDEGSYVLRCAY